MVQGKNLYILIIRAASIGLKTFFIFFTAKFLTLDEFGKLALINNGISLMLSIMGLNFFNYTSRIIVNAKEDKTGILHHFIFTSFTGLISLAFLPLLIKFGGIDSSHFLKFGLILYLEHIFTEIFRVQIPLNKNVQANVIHFLKVCCSSLFPLTAFWFFDDGLNLNNILDIWFVSLMLLIFILILTKVRISDFINFKFSIDFVKSGLMTSFIYLLISILGRSLFTLDKFIVNQVSGPSEVGIYAFYYSMAFTVQTLIETSFISPSLYEMLKTSNLKKSFNELIKKVIVTSLVIGGSLIALKSIILSLLNRVEFISEYQLLYIFILGASIYSMALATMMPLYARKKDKEILFSYFLTFIFFIFLNLIHRNDFYEIALNMTFSYGFLFAVLLIQYRRMIRTNNDVIL